MKKIQNILLLGVLLLVIVLIVIVIVIIILNSKTNVKTLTSKIGDVSFTAATITKKNVKAGWSSGKQKIVISMGDVDKAESYVC